MKHHHYGASGLTLLAMFFLLMALLLAGCGIAPTAPTAAGPLRLALAGQSNAMLIRPFLGDAVVSFYGEVQPIAPCWSASGSCWTTLRPSLPSTLDAFVWSQGEYDAVLDPPTPIAEYASRQTDLVARVRAATGNPRLLVVVLQLGPMFDGPRGGTLGREYQAFKREWAATDVNAVYVSVEGLEYRADEVHMTDAGYAGLSARIVAAVAERAR